MSDLIRLSFYSFSALSLQVALVALCCLCLGIFVLRRKPGSPLAVTVSLLCFSFAVWLGSCALMYAAADSQTALRWARFAHCGICLIPAIADTYGVQLMPGLHRSNWKQITVWIASIIFLFLFVFTDLPFSSLYRYSWGAYPRYSPACIAFLLFFFGVIANALRYLINGFCEVIKDPIQLNRARFILVPFLLAMIACVDFFPAFGVPLYPFGHIFIFIYIICVFRSVQAFRLLPVGPTLAAARIIETMHEAVIVCDRDGLISFVNRATCDMFGHDEKELLNKLPSLCLTDKAFAEKFESLVKAGGVRNIELQSRSQGRIRTLNLSASTVEDGKGDLFATFCVISDITDRKLVEDALLRARDELEIRVLERTSELTGLNEQLLAEVRERAAIEDELHRSRQMLQLVMDNIPQQVFWKDLDLRYMGCNKTFADSAGLKHPMEIVGRDDSLMPWTDSAEIYRETDRRVIEDNAPLLNYEEKVEREDGTVSWLIRNKVPLHDRDGKVIGVLGTIQNITEKMRIREALQFTQFAVDQAVFPIYWLDVRGRFSYANEACRYLGYPMEELATRTIFDIIPELSEDNWTWHWQEIIKKGFDTFELCHRTREGDLVPVELTVHPVEQSGEVFHVTYVRDIRERKKAEEKIRRQVERLAALRAIDEAISASLDLGVTLKVVLDHIIKQLGVDAADILLLNKAYKLKHTASRGFRTRALRHTALPIGMGNAGMVAKEKRTMHIPDVRNGENPFKSAPLLEEEGFISYYGLPLIAKGQTVGVLEIFFRSAQKLEQERLDFLETLAGQAAIAIDNASLFSGLQKSNQELTLAYDSTLEGWSRALDLRDKETEGHSQRVTEMTEQIAKIMDLPEIDIIHIRRGAMLHDIGKMGIPDQVLLKNGPLDENEMAIIRQHPVYAFELLSPIAFLRPALDIPYCHHERWDGSGYPRGLKGKQIPLAARIFAIVDVWDALRSDRPYRQAWPFEKTREHVLKLSGRQFDPQVVEAFKCFIDCSQ